LSSRGLCKGPVGNMFVNSKAPHCWLLLLPLMLLLLMCRLLGRLTIGCMENDSCECLHVCFPQSEKQPSLTLAIFTHSVRMPQKKSLKGLSEEEACSRSSMHGCPTGLFIAVPLAFAYASANSLSCLSLCSFSWPLCCAIPSAGEWSSENRARGFILTHWEAIFESALKTTRNYLFLTSNPAQKGLQE